MTLDKDSLIEEQIHQIKSYLSGELNPDELKAFETWLEASDNNRKLFDRINNPKLILENIHFAELNDKEKGDFTTV
jgi:anti-sigma factor RsiW